MTKSSYFFIGLLVGVLMVEMAVIIGYLLLGKP